METLTWKWGIIMKNLDIETVAFLVNYINKRLGSSGDITVNTIHIAGGYLDINNNLISTKSPISIDLNDLTNNSELELIRQELDLLKSNLSTTEIDSIEEILNELENKANKTSILTYEILESQEVILEHNIEKRYSEVNTMELIFPTELPSDYISSIVFTSGAIATNLIIPDNIIWIGDDCVDGEPFLPIENTRYTIIFENDGLNIIASVRGYLIQEV